MIKGVPRDAFFSLAEAVWNLDILPSTAALKYRAPLVLYFKRPKAVWKNPPIKSGIKIPHSYATVFHKG